MLSPSSQQADWCANVKHLGSHRKFPHIAEQHFDQIPLQHTTPNLLHLLTKRANPESLTDQVEDSEDEVYYGNAVVGSTSSQPSPSTLTLAPRISSFLARRARRLTGALAC